MINEIFTNTVKRRYKAYLPLIMLALGIFIILFNFNIFFKGRDIGVLGYRRLFAISDYIMTIFYIGAGILIAMSCRAVTQKYNRELFIYKFIGLSNNKIVFTYLLILFITICISVFIAIYISLLFMNAFCSFSMSAFTDTKIAVIYFNTPIINMLYTFIIVTASSLSVYGIALLRQIKNTPIISGLNDFNYYTVSQVSRSAKTEEKRVGYIGWLYFKRTLYGNINDIAIVALVMILPMLLLVMALISRAQTQVMHKDQLCSITYTPPNNAAPTWITREFCDALLDIDGVQSLEYGAEAGDNTYAQVWVYAKGGMEEKVQNKISALIAGGDYKMDSYYNDIGTTEIFSASYYYFFLSQSVLFMLCSFIIILLQQWSTMLRRKREFVIYKVLGYSPSEIAHIMRSRYIDLTVSVLLTTLVVNLLIFIYSRYEKTTTIFTVFKSLPGISGLLFTALHIIMLFGFAYAAAAISGAHMLKKIKSDEISVNSGDVL